MSAGLQYSLVLFSEKTLTATSKVFVYSTTSAANTNDKKGYLNLLQDLMKYIEEGYDDYMNIDVYEWNGERPLMEVINEIRENDGYIDDIDGLEDTDGGMMLIKRADYNNSGDIRDYLENALDFVNYRANDDENLYKDLIFITAHS